MDDDRNEHDDLDDDEDEILPELSMAELGALLAPDGPQGQHDLCIEERIIPDLAEVLKFSHAAGRALTVVECLIDGGRIERTDVDLFIDESEFTGALDFRDGVFRGKVSFHNVEFEEDVDAASALFDGEVVFQDCMFQGESNFSSALFRKKVAFQSCEFFGRASFDRATFADEVDFSNTDFIEETSYLRTQFQTSVNLSSTTFGKTPEKEDSNLDEMSGQKDQIEDPSPTPHKHPTKRIKLPGSTKSIWQTFDSASKKSISRRSLLRGLFRFLPEKPDEETTE